MVSQETLSTIRLAIKGRKHLIFDMHGYHREMCPHVLGRKKGEWHMFGWQFGGLSKGGFKNDDDRWRCCPVEDMKDIYVNDGEWYRGVRTGRGKHPSTCIDDDEIDTLIEEGYGAVVRNN